MRPFSAPAGTLIHANRFRFGPSYSVSKLLKFFKLLGQCPDTENQSNRTIISLSAVLITCPPNCQKSEPQNRCRNILLWLEKSCADRPLVAEPAVIVESKSWFRFAELHGIANSSVGSGVRPDQAGVLLSGVETDFR
jgi:hypothetical protein